MKTSRPSSRRRAVWTIMNSASLNSMTPSRRSPFAVHGSRFHPAGNFEPRTENRERWLDVTVLDLRGPLQFHEPRHAHPLLQVLGVGGHTVDVPLQVSVHPGPLGGQPFLEV